MKNYLYIDVDAFFASVEQAVNRRLIGRPVMVGGLKHERGVVACPSYEARARGVTTGTPLHTAARLIPDGVFLKGDYHCYQHYSERFYEILYKYSPDIRKISQDEACLDISSRRTSVAGRRRLAESLQEDIYRQLKLSTSIGIAPSRIASKIASEYRKPGGLTLLHEGNLDDFLAGLPIRKIPGIGSVTEKILIEMGIRKAGDLARVPDKYLHRIFGLNGLKMAAHCRGQDGPPLRDHRAIRSVSRETGFPDDITDRDLLLAHYFYLLERAGARLRAVSRKAAAVKIKFRYADFRTIEAAAALRPASCDEHTIFPLVKMMFHRAFSRRLGIRLVGVTLGNLKPHSENETLFEDTAAKQRRLLQGIDAARHKAGFFALMTGRTLMLSQRYRRGDTGYVLRTPSLSQ